MGAVRGESFLTPPNIGEEQIGNGGNQEIYRRQREQFIQARGAIQSIDAVFGDFNRHEQNAYDYRKT